MYTNSEMTDIHFTYDRANGNATNQHACIMQLIRIADSQACFPKFINAYVRLENLSRILLNTVDRDLLVLLYLDETVLHRIEENPGTLYDQLLHSCSTLMPVDFLPRITLCQWLLNRCIQHSLFLCNILFTDEASFTRDGINNFHNNHPRQHRISY